MTSREAKRLACYLVAQMVEGAAQDASSDFDLLAEDLIRLSAALRVVEAELYRRSGTFNQNKGLDPNQLRLFDGL